jgi:methionine-rich copper-binding protein CopC
MGLRSFIIATGAIAAAGFLLVTAAFAHAPIGTVAWDNPTQPTRVIATSRGDDISTEYGTFSLEVRDASGVRVDLGNVAVVDAKNMTVSVKGNLAPGSYTVTWKTASADDGDTASGTLPLVLAGSAPAQTAPTVAPAPATAPQTTAAAAPRPPATGDGGLLDDSSTTPVAPFAGLLVGIVSAVAVVGFKRPSSEPKTTSSN